VSLLLGLGAGMKGVTIYSFRNLWHIVLVSIKVLIVFVTLVNRNKKTYRYSAEFTVYRELIQNANDAGAKAVEIHFQSERIVRRV